MKRFYLLCGCLLTGLWPSMAAAQDDEIAEFQREEIIRSNPLANARRPRLDPKRIINESNSFLKEREPEMNSEEYALYEKVGSMLATNSAFALKLLEAMMDAKEPPSPAFEFILGNAYYAAGQSDKSEQFYKSALKRYPSFLRAWNNLGVLYYSTDRFAEAVPCFSKSVVLGDRDPMTFGLLGYSLEKIGNPVSAELAYMQALGGDPSNVDWKEGLLRICIEEKQFGRAESLVKDLIKENPKEARFWLVYANILLSDKRKTEAMAVLETAASGGVAGIAELELLGDLYAEQNLVNEAIAIYQKVLVPSKEVGERKLLFFAQVLIGAAKYAEAQSVLDSIKTALSPDGRIKFLQARADILIAQQRWVDARKELQTLLELAPLNGRALLSLGTTYVAEDDLSHATFAFEAAFRIPATTYRASLELANVELKNRHYEKTIEYLKRALSIERTDAVEDHLARVKTLVPTEG